MKVEIGWTDGYSPKGPLAIVNTVLEHYILLLRLKAGYILQPNFMIYT